MRILLWHVHGSWTTAFVQGRHTYLVPVLPDRAPDGVGRARSWTWPQNVIEITPEQLGDELVDLVVLQRPNEIELVQRWLGREPGVDIPAVYLEHNTPADKPCEQRHVVAERADIPLVHVTYFNELFWDNGRARTQVIEHGIVDPGARYTGELSHGAVVVNEPGRRGRVVGADLIPRFAEIGPVDVFGMRTKEFVADQRTPSMTAYQDLFSQDQMHDQLARRRVYLHPVRWTSLGLSLLEAMQLAMPVVALATTEVCEAVPPGAGRVSTDIGQLIGAYRTFLHEPEAARAAGLLARAAALDRYGLARFLQDWDRLMSRTIGEG